MDSTVSIAQRAVENFMEGYNCAQAVFAAFAPELGLTEQQAALMASALGGGVCRCRETCGAVTGGMLALGCALGYNDPKATTEKMALYERGQRLVKAFEEKFGTVCCGKLLELPKSQELSPIPTPRTAQFYQDRPCARFVYEMARLVDEEIRAAKAKAE